MSDNLARPQPSTDDDRPRPELMRLDTGTRPMRKPGGAASERFPNGEPEIIIDSSMWIVFNRRLLTLISRKRYSR